MVLAALAFLVSAQVSAAPALTFESSLGQLRQTVVAARAEQVRAKNAALKHDLTRLANDARTLQWQGWNLRTRVGDVRRRAARYIPPRPGKPESDPFLRSELSRLTWDLRDHAWKAESAARDAQRIEREATQDPELVGPAEQLSFSARDYANETRWLAIEARNASWDVRRAGFSMEAWDLERESGNAENDSRDLETYAQRILAKVR